MRSVKFALLLSVILQGCVIGKYEQKPDGTATFQYNALFHKASFKGLTINSDAKKTGFRISSGVGAGDPESIDALANLIGKAAAAAAKSAVVP